jgi:hypothetical protein
MGRDGQRSAVIAYEYAMAALLVPPVNAVLAGHRLEIADPPIQLAPSHHGKKLGCACHAR